MADRESGIDGEGTRLVSCGRSLSGDNSEDMMLRWRSLAEVCCELRLGPKAVLGMLNSGQLKWFRLRSRNGRGRLRILDPSPQLVRHVQESQRHLEHVPLLSSREVAEVLGLQPSAIRQIKRRGGVQGRRVGKTTLYTVDEIRRLFRARTRKSERGRHEYCPILARWLRSILEDDRYLAGDILIELIQQAVRLPAPRKSRYVTELWRHFDAINSLLRSARDDEDFEIAQRKAKVGDLQEALRVVEVNRISGSSLLVSARLAKIGHGFGSAQN